MKLLGKLEQIRDLLMELIKELDEPAQKTFYSKMFEKICWHIGELKKREISNGKLL